MYNSLEEDNTSESEDNTSESEYSDLETPLSTASFFQNVRNIDAIKDQLGTDSGMWVVT